MQSFSDCLDFCGLKDLGFSGLPFTWCNRRFDGNVVWVQLDRAVASLEWVLKFPAVRLYHLSGLSSDHKPIWLCSDDIRKRFFRPNKPFGFEAMWIKDDRCEGAIHEAWDKFSTADLIGNVLLKVSNYQTHLSEWNKKVFGNVQRTLEKKRRELEQAEHVAAWGGGCGRLKELNAEIRRLTDMEDCMWNQRAKVDWLHDGDKNTKYFHCRSTERNKRNYISGLENELGFWVEEESQIGGMLVQYFSNLFTSSNPINLDLVLEGVLPVVNDEMNEGLNRPFEPNEVQGTLKQMEVGTAPGSDGLPPLFYKQYWSKVEQEVTSVVLAILNSGIVPSQLNHTFLTLIPKIHSPRKVTYFRPITLSNVLYKIVAKVLADRLKILLPKLISEHQSAFISGRLITDNILIAHETLHHLKSKRASRMGYMALKLDMRKAYDRVEWVFLEKIMLKMGFNVRWVSTIMACIKSVSYSILLNGQPHGHIVPERGLRQGDPLSPYLFLLVTEGMHSLFKKAEENRVIRSVSLCVNGPRISYLLFADDSLVFCRATISKCVQIQSILHRYEQASG